MRKVFLNKIEINTQDIRENYPNAYPNCTVYIFTITLHMYSLHLKLPPRVSFTFGIREINLLTVYELFTMKHCSRSATLSRFAFRFWTNYLVIIEAYFKYLH